MFWATGRVKNKAVSKKIVKISLFHCKFLQPTDNICHLITMFALKKKKHTGKTNKQNTHIISSPVLLFYRLGEVTDHEDLSASQASNLQIKPLYNRSKSLQSPPLKSKMQKCQTVFYSSLAKFIVMVFFVWLVGF